MAIKLYESIWIFLFTGYVGWLGEVVYAAYVERRFVNRGFLNGPFCPIYGIGLVVINLTLSTMANNFILLFLGSMLIGSIVEWIAGFILEHLFQQKWWDYSDKKLNLNGYICLSFSILWGFAGMLVVRFALPNIKNLIWLIPQRFGIILVSVFSFFILVDVFITLIVVGNLNRRLKTLEAITAGIKDISDRLGTVLAGGVLGFMEKYEELEAKHKSDFADMKVKYEGAMKKNRMLSRMFKAFPNLRSLQYNVELETLKSAFQLKKGKRSKK